MMVGMLENTALRAGDLVLEWLLYLPRDAAIVLVALLTSAVLALARRLATDQDWLRRARDDRRRLKTLAREAARAGDREAAQRHASVLTAIRLRGLRQELRALLCALLPVVALAAWGFARLAYHPPRAGETVAVRMRLPRSAAGRVAHMVPQNGVTAEEGWVRPVAVDGPTADGIAFWRLRAEARERPYDLRIVYDGRVYEKELRAGGRTYAAPVRVVNDGGPVRAIETALRPARLFGVVPGIPALRLPPWLVAYLLVAWPCAALLRRVLRIV